MPHVALHACVTWHDSFEEAHQSSSSLSSYRKGMAWKTWKAIMPRLLGKRANTNACRPLLPLQRTSACLRHQPCCNVAPSHSQLHKTHKSRPGDSLVPCNADCHCE